MELASRVAPHPTTVLITGESGTGKEVVARAIHRMSPRRDLRMVAVNCAAIPENLLESELFGHRRGAFTGASVDKPGLFEEADGSTLLLDEVGELPLALQVKLLRVLQEGEVRRVGAQQVQKVDVRVMAATARDLEAEVVEGRFREDLYYRINVVHIHVPPLRDRLEDLDALVNAFVARLAARSGQRVSITPDAREAIRNHAWPGNVRELENALERAVVLSADATIRPDVLDLHSPQRPIDGGGACSLKEVAAAAEARAIDAALEAAGGSRAEAAKQLGISQRSLFYKLKEYGIS
jgi:two-component system response regulator AtoC